MISYYFSAQDSEGKVWTDPGGAPATSHDGRIGDSETVAFVEDFEQDNGWTVTNSKDLTAGAWERDASGRALNSSCRV